MEGGISQQRVTLQVPPKSAELQKRAEKSTEEDRERQWHEKRIEVS
jgi:hypothetical protein